MTSSAKPFRSPFAMVWISLQQALRWELSLGWIMKENDEDCLDERPKKATEEVKVGDDPGQRSKVRGRLNRSGQARSVQPVR